MNWIKHIITGADKQTVDAARVFWIVGVLAFLGLSAFEVYRSGHFNMTVRSPTAVFRLLALLA